MRRNMDRIQCGSGGICTFIPEPEPDPKKLPDIRYTGTGYPVVP